MPRPLEASVDPKEPNFLCYCMTLHIGIKNPHQLTESKFKCSLKVDYFDSTQAGRPMNSRDFDTSRTNRPVLSSVPIGPFFIQVQQHFCRMTKLNPMGMQGQLTATVM